MRLSTRFIRPLQAAAVAVAVFSSASAVAGPTNVPFSATLVTQEAIIPVSYGQPNPGACTYLIGKTSGSGQATHLGLVTGSGTDCITPTSPYSYAFSKGTLTLIAANGDELHATYSGTLTPTSTTTPVYAINGTYQIAGGTGRFTNATGSGTLGGLENIVTGQGTFQFNGAISY